MTEGLTAGGNTLDRIVVTQVADAARDAESITSVATPAATGYTRALRLPSCDRCTILAGRFYRWNEGFHRHPRCDCHHIPCDRSTAADLTTSPLLAIQSGQVTGLSAADRRAILEDGADPAKVINAKRADALSTAQVYGRRVKVTTEGTSKRSGNATIRAIGADGKAFNARPRPAAIYQLADDRGHALDLLREYGYLR